MNARRVVEVPVSVQKIAARIFKISRCSSCESNTVFVLLGCVRLVNDVLICKLSKVAFANVK